MKYFLLLLSIATTSYSLDSNQELIVTTIESAPFVTKDAKTGHLTGFCVDLMEKLSAQVGQRMRMRLVKDGNFGGLTSSGTWTGMIGELINKEADMAIAPLSITENRLKVVDYTQPFMSSGLSVLLKKPDEIEFDIYKYTFDAINVFPPQMWMTLVIAYIASSIVLFIVVRVSPIENTSNRPTMNIVDCLYFTGGALFTQHHGIVIRSLASRLIAIAWWLFSLLITVTFIVQWLSRCAVVAANYDVVTSIEQLSYRNDITVAVVNGGHTMQWMKNSADETINRLWRRVKSNRMSLVENYTVGIDRVRNGPGKYAFVIEGTANDYINSMSPCDTYRMAGPVLSSINYGIAMPYQSKYKLEIETALEHLRETNVLRNLKAKWWHEKAQCADFNTISKDENPDARFGNREVIIDLLKLPKNWYFTTFQILIIFLIGVLIAAIIIVILEFFIVGCCDDDKNASLGTIYKRQCIRMCCGTRTNSYAPVDTYEIYRPDENTIENGSAFGRSNERNQPMVYKC